MTAIEGLLFAAVGGLVVFAAARAVNRTVIHDFERGVLHKGGRPAQVLAPGSYWWSPRHSRLDKLDMRPRYVTLTGQEVLSSDQVGFKVTLAARYAVADPLAALLNSERYDEALYLELQLALREVIGSLSAEALLERRGELGANAFERATPRVTALGLTLHAADLKDIMFPGYLKRIFAQVAKAKQEGLAALERARGETAALRSLANAARLVQDNPALLQLRMIQAIAESSGHTIAWGDLTVRGGRSDGEG